MSLVCLLLVTSHLHAAGPALVDRRADGSANRGFDAVVRTPTSAPEVFEAVAHLVYAPGSSAKGIEAARVLGHLTAHALGQTAEGAVRRSLSWAEARRRPDAVKLDASLAAVLTASDIPLEQDERRTTGAVPEAVLMLETLATRSATREAAGAALAEVYEALAEVLISVARNRDGQSNDRVNEVVTEIVKQAMAWLASSPHPASAAALRTVAEAYDGRRESPLNLLAEQAGHVLILKAKRANWLATARACAEVLSQESV